MDANSHEFITPPFEDFGMVDLGVVHDDRARSGPSPARRRSVETIGSAGQERDPFAYEVQDRRRIDLVIDGLQTSSGAGPS
ncbi:hypothetical protein [Streptomyces sp. NPDC101150]|uniref:hypothetical protein n=1 Tax=Streptomyces sp. NPDC101150 TaxID=3366114 RepID=UPI003807DA1A